MRNVQIKPYRNYVDAEVIECVECNQDFSRRPPTPSVNLSAWARESLQTLPFRFHFLSPMEQAEILQRQAEYSLPSEMVSAGYESLMQHLRYKYLMALVVLLAILVMTVAIGLNYPMASFTDEKRPKTTSYFDETIQF